MDFLLFLLVTAVLFLRPQDHVPELASLQVYAWLLALCAIVACGSIARQLSSTALGRRPITVCVLGLLLAIVMSHLAHTFIYGARIGAVSFFPVLLYYLLLVGIVNSPARLQWFLSWVGGCLVVITVLSLLAYHGQITLPQKALLEMAEVDEQTGEATLWQRLCGTGVFNDPNDLCLVLLLCMSIALYRLTGPAAGLARLGWLAGLALCFAAFMLTRSRGGFVAFLVWGLVLCHARFGIWKTLVTAGAALPVLFLLFSGRATNFTDRADAGQDRIELWSDALGLFREAPLFGIGWRMFEDRAGLVAHNSFLHCYAELGFFGGTLFIGAFFTALWVLYRLRPAARSVDPELWRLRPYLLAALTAYTVGLLTLSRPYITPTYLILGLVTAYVGMAGPPLLLPRFDLRHLGRLTVVGLAFLFAMHLFVRTAIHRG